MPKVDHALHPDDRSEMNAMRAYFALQPKLAIVSPRFGAKKGMPNVMIHVGADEILLDDATGYADAAATDLAKVDVHVWAGMTHVFPSNVATLQAAREALDLSVRFLRTCLERGVQ
jgi:epsilon-lactone hydrolase